MSYSTWIYWHIKLGPIKYVITPKKKKIPILSVIIVKKDDLDQGRAQLYMQLHNEFIENDGNDNVFKDLILYGVYTNALNWCFVKYDPSKYNPNEEDQDKDLFIEIKEIMINDEHGLEKMIEQLIGIIHQQDQEVSKIVKKK